MLIFQFDLVDFKYFLTPRTVPSIVKDTKDTLPIVFLIRWTHNSRGSVWWPESQSRCQDDWEPVVN